MLNSRTLQKLIRSYVALNLTLLATLLSAQERSRPLTVPLKTAAGDAVGTATFRQTLSGKLSIAISLKNLTEGDHAIHIHQNPVCNGGLDFKTAGNHFNPTEKQHGTLNPLGHHSGDLPQNITINRIPQGTNSILVGETNFTISGLSMDPGAANSVLNRSIIVHDKPDDMKTDPTGNAGNRIACGVIRVQ